MRFYTSYFYQIRNFPTSLLPVSTAIYDPKWYKLSPYGLPVPDKRGVYIGYNYRALHLPKTWYSELEKEGYQCEGKNCPDLNRLPCRFMRLYKDYLSVVNYESFLNKIQSWLTYTHCEDVCLMVHEPSTCLCAERPVLQEWIRNHGYQIEEWRP